MERFNSFSSDQIIVTKRQASMIMASMLLFCLFIFIIGFFLGKRAMIDDFSSKVTKEALHDQIDFLLTTQSLQSSQDSALDDDTIIQVSNETELQDESFGSVQQIESDAAKQLVFTEDRPGKNIRPEDFPVLDDKKIDDIQSSLFHVKKPQYAQLIGFGTKQAAQAFVTRLKKANISVILKTMMSKTAAGKQRTWYQAITPTYDTAEELQAQVSKIKRLEHIRENDIKTVYVK